MYVTDRHVSMKRYSKAVIHTTSRFVMTPTPLEAVLVLAGQRELTPTPGSAHQIPRHQSPAKRGPAKSKREGSGEEGCVCVFRYAARSVGKLRIPSQPASFVSNIS